MDTGTRQRLRAVLVANLGTTDPAVVPALLHDLEPVINEAQRVARIAARNHVSHFVRDCGHADLATAIITDEF